MSYSVAQKSPGRAWSPGLEYLQRRRSRSIDAKKLLTMTKGFDLNNDDDCDDVEPDYLSSFVTTTPSKVNRGKLKDQNNNNSRSDIRAKSSRAKSKERRRTSSGRGRSKSSARTSPPSTPPDGHHRRSYTSNVPQSPVGVALDEDPPLEIQKKLQVVFDEVNTPLRERLEREAEMLKVPEERRWLVHCRRQLKNQGTLAWMEYLDKTKQEEMALRLAEEEARAIQEQKELEHAKRLRKQEKAEKKRQEQKRLSEIRIHQAETIAQDAEELRTLAEQTKKVTQQRLKEQEKERKKREKYKQRMLKKETNDVCRELAEARYDQVPIPNRKY